MIDIDYCLAILGMQNCWRKLSHIEKLKSFEFLQKKTLLGNKVADAFDNKEAEIKADFALDVDKKFHLPNVFCTSPGEKFKS